jgi:predicted RNase H-like HicB family nuclease
LRFSAAEEIIRESGGQKMEISVRAEWDDVAKVWVATSEDVPGLATEAETLEALSAKLERLIPELLEANGAPTKTQVPFELLAQSRHTANAVLRQAGLPKHF